MLRVGVVGTGLISHQNVPALLRTNKVEIVGLCNRTIEKGEAFRDKYKLECPVYGSDQEMYQKERPHVVLIQTPHDLHVEEFCYFAEKGANILIEKPLADTEEGALQIARAVRKHKILATVCQTQRYNPCYRTARAFLDSGKPGELISIVDTITYDYFYEGRPSWFLNPDRAGGGLIMNYGVHQLDRVSYLCGQETAQLFAHIETKKEGEQIDSSYHIMGVTVGGVSYQVSSTGYTGPFQSFTEMRFTNGILRMNLTDTGFGNKGVFWGDNTHGFEEVPQVGQDDMYYYQMRDAVDYFIGERNTPPVSVDYAAGLVQLVAGAKESARTGQVVKF